MTAAAMNWSLALPEIVLSLCAMAILIFGVLRKPDPAFLCTMLALGALILAGVLAVSAPQGSAYRGLFVVDGFGTYMKLLILAGAGLSAVLALDWNVKAGISRFEFPVLILLSTVGMMIMSSTSSLMTLYLGLELQSLALYVLCAFDRDNVRSAESGLKFFVLGALASGLLLYGISLAYGFAGTMQFGELAQALSDPSKASPGLVVGVVFIVAGLAFKLSAVPFHMWTPDVYEGAPTPVTAFMSTAPKVAAIALLLRALEVPFGHLTPQWTGLIVLVSIASMLLGSLAAIGQTNIKRLMAYSSIGHMGYALVGLAVGTTEGIRGVLIYMVTYVFMSRRGVRLHHRHAPPRAVTGTDQRPVGAGDDGPGPGVGHDGVHVQHGGHPAFLRLLRQAVCVPAGGAGGVLDPGGHRRADQRGRGLLLLARYQGDVFRQGGGGVRRPAHVRVLRRRGGGLGDDAVLRVPGAAGGRRAVRRAGAVRVNPVAPPGWRLRHYESLASTSDLCVSLAQAGEPARLAVMAARQTHARGSRGRTWQTLPGNLALSVLLRPAGRAADAGQWALLAAVALAEALEQATPGVTLQVKWPNDVMLAGAKVGGILIDTALAGTDRLDWLVLGFGANLGAAPDVPGREAGMVAAAAGPAAAALLNRLDHWDRTRLLDGFAPIRQAWLNRGPAPGSPLRVRWGNADLGGTFAGLGEDGALLLQSGGRVRALPTGEVLQMDGG